MISISRRNLLKATIAVPVAMTLPSDAFANTIVVRHDISTPQGLDMLAIYAGAVRAMQAMGPENPMSWMWQWYTHFVDGTTTKSDEVMRIFGDTVSPLRTLAEQTWNTCQSHAGQNPNHFLPWHRMFVYYFERIVRQVSGRPDFTLPYWDYTSPDPLKRGVVPEQFRLPTDPVYEVLYRAARTALANNGEPIHKNQPNDVMNIDDLLLKEAYSSAGSVQGFCRTIDNGIHSRMHVLLGNRFGMGSVPYAGNDPLFWVHHSNIDRIWASWNRSGGKNPRGTTWGQTFFYFSDANGVRAVRKLSDFFSVLDLGYKYDVYIPRPQPPPPPPPPPPEEPPPPPPPEEPISDPTTTSSATVVPGDGTVARSPSPAQLSARPVDVPLLPLPGTRKTPVLGLDPAQPDKRVYLVLSKLHTWKQPEVLFHVYLRPGKGSGKLDKAAYVGNINFFDAEFHDHGGGAQDLALGENFYSFDVTDRLHALRRSGAAGANGLTVTLVPAGTPTAGAEPLVATVELVRQ